MKSVQGRVTASRPLDDDYADEDCLCLGKVPDNKRIDVQQRIFNEKKQKHVWKTFVRAHQDCPIHGCHPKE